MTKNGAHMTSTIPRVYDAVGIGFGPSNLSLATALHDAVATSAHTLDVLFLESQSSFGWHRNMLLPSAKMQVSFLKDLVTFRNPNSKFSFVSYLHAVGRLPQFVNNGDFFPTRREFHQYLEWVAANFTDLVTYGTRVTEILPLRSESGTSFDRFRLTATSTNPGQGSTQIEARNIVLATGLVPKMPYDTVPDDRIWHSSEFLSKFKQSDPARLGRVAVVGAGQSAAEIARFCYDHAPKSTITAVVPSYGYAIADNTPFANQVFDPEAVDDYYFSEKRGKERFWESHRNTNYSVVDDEVIRSLYQRKYDDEVSGSGRLKFLELSRVTGVKHVGDETKVTIHSLARDEFYDVDVDVVIFATGYDNMGTGGILEGVKEYCLKDDNGSLRVERNYRVVTIGDLHGGIYLQGGTEHTHGLTSSLLSNLATRSGEIATSLLDQQLPQAGI